MVKEISGGEEAVQDVGEHVGHVLIDAGAVRLAVDLVAMLDESWHMEGLGLAVPARVCEARAIAEAIV